MVPFLHLCCSIELLILRITTVIFSSIDDEGFSQFSAGEEGLEEELLPEMICRAMVQEAVQGIPSVYAREMERLSTQESLILAINDFGGFEALVTGKITDMQRMMCMRLSGLTQLIDQPRGLLILKVDAVLSGLDPTFLVHLLLWLYPSQSSYYEVSFVTHRMACFQDSPRRV